MRNFSRKTFQLGGRKSFAADDLPPRICRNIKIRPGTDEKAWKIYERHEEDFDDFLSRPFPHTAHILRRKDLSLVKSFTARKICLELHSKKSSETHTRRCCCLRTATICHKLSFLTCSDTLPALRLVLINGSLLFPLLSPLAYGCQINWSPALHVCRHRLWRQWVLISCSSSRSLLISRPRRGSVIFDFMLVTRSKSIRKWRCVQSIHGAKVGSVKNFVLIKAHLLPVRLGSAQEAVSLGNYRCVGLQKKSAIVETGRAFFRSIDTMPTNEQVDCVAKAQSESKTKRERGKNIKKTLRNFQLETMNGKLYSW